MKQLITKFLEFNGKNLLFLLTNGIYYIAVKPVCEALNVDYVQQFKNLNADPILGTALCKHTMQVPGDQARNMVCLPEQFIYGWIFSIKSDSPELIEYKRECYQILFAYFHGSITGRRELIREKAMIRHERLGLEEDLRQNEKFVKLEEIRAKEARLGIHLKRIDRQEMDQQYTIFD